MEKVLNTKFEFKSNKMLLGLMISLVFSIFILTIISIKSTYGTNINWWNDSFDYRKQLNITSVSSIDLTDFPIYLNISYESGMQTNYTDLRFINGECIGTENTQLNYEIEYFDTNKAVVWVKIPNLQTTGNKICMYYGNSSVTTNQNPTAVWKTNYGIVYHMNSLGEDTTANNRDRVSNIGTPTADDTYLGYGRAFNGTDAWNMANIAYWEQGWTERTHEILFKTGTDITTRQTLFAEGGGTNGIMMYILNGQLYSRWWSESNPNWPGNHFNTSILANTIYHAAMQLKENGDYSLYLNGELVMNLSTPDRIDAHTGDGGIAYTGTTGKDYHDLPNSAGNYFKGSIHEMRVFDTDESDDWINMSAQNMLNHQLTLSYASQEKLTPTINITITNPSPLTTPLVEQNKTIDVNVTITCSGKPSLDCGNISSFYQYNNSESTYANISNISGTTPIWTTSNQGQYCQLMGGESCIQTWMLNITGNLNQRIKTKGYIKSNNTELNDANSEFLIIKVHQGNAVIFNQSFYTFETFTKFSGARDANISIKSLIGANSNINISCKSGDCATITDNWNDATNLSLGETKNVTFTCDDSLSGQYSAIFNLTSSEQIGENLITISCNVDPVYGPIQFIINTPSTSSTTNVRYQKEIKLNATLNCVGICENVTAYAVTSHTLGDGTDGSLIVSSANTIINDYTYLLGDEINGSSTILVNDVTQFNIGDEIMILQMQNGSGIGSAGTYEYKTILSKNVGTLTLTEPLENSYGSGTFNIPSASATQIIRIPQYTDVTIQVSSSITAPAWNGYTGGVVAFRATGVVNTLGFINVSAKGFRGGDCNGCGDSAWGDQGEGYLGTGIGALAANGNGGGGGYGPTGYGGEPGGGGGYGTSGSNGVSSFTTIGGESIGSANLSKILFGGGAGGGGDDDNNPIKAQYVDGAGAVIIHAKKIENANIECNGENGVGNGATAGTTGGGAGGTIWLSALDISIANLSAKGGLGFIDTDDVGGDGGDGRIRIDYVNLNGNSINPTAGYNGNISDIFNIISNVYATKPLWTTSSQPQWCIPTEDGSCSFEWKINATGKINSTHNISVIGYSNLSSIKVNTSLNAQIKIVNITTTIPQITLIEPINNQKIISETGDITFKWNITDEETLLNCTLYVDNIEKINNTCYTNITNNITLNLPFGDHNWSIYAINSLNGTNISQVYNFTIIENQHKKIRKQITNTGVDLYSINITILNLLNSSQDIILTDFTDTNFNSYSFIPGYDFTNISTGLYNGNLYSWDLTLTALSNITLNYLTIKVGLNTDYNLIKNSLVALD